MGRKRKDNRQYNNSERELNENYEGNVRTLFFATILNFALGEIPFRRDVLHYLAAQFANCTFMVVGYGDMREPYGIEVLFENSEKICPNIVRNVFEARFPNNPIHFDQVKALDSKLRYISRLDLDIVYCGNVKLNHFNEYWKKYDYFKQCGKELNKMHPYYSNLKSPNQRNVLMQDFREWKKKNVSLSKHYLIYNDYKGWQWEVVDWYNRKVSQGFDECLVQMFLYGGSGRGKTSFFKHLFGRFTDQTFYPVTSECSRWQWEGFHQNLYSFIFVDEFDFRDFNINKWKLITDGGCVNVEIKNVSGGEIIRALLPIFMISNYPPIHDDMDPNDKEAVKRRIKAVMAVAFHGDFDFKNKKLRFIRSLDTADEPLTLEQVAALPYEFDRQASSTAAQSSSTTSTTTTPTVSPNNNNNPIQISTNIFSPISSAMTSGYSSLLSVATSSSSQASPSTPRQASTPRSPALQLKEINIQKVLDLLSTNNPEIQEQVAKAKQLISEELMNLSDANTRTIEETTEDKPMTPRRVQSRTNSTSSTSSKRSMINNEDDDDSTSTESKRSCLIERDGEESMTSAINMFVSSIAIDPMLNSACTDATIAEY